MLPTLLYKASDAAVSLTSSGSLLAEYGQEVTRCPLGGPVGQPAGRVGSGALQGEPPDHHSSAR